VMMQNAKKSGYIRAQIGKFGAGVGDRILENGATMLLASNIPKDWSTAAWEIAATIDPSGVIGFGNSFVPKPNCDDSNYMAQGIPPTGAGEDLDALDIVPGRWDGLSGVGDPRPSSDDYGLIKSGYECANQRHEHDLGNAGSVGQCAFACAADASCSQHGTFIYGHGSKRNRCWSEGVTTCTRWERDQYNFYTMKGYFLEKANRECNQNSNEHRLSNQPNVEGCAQACKNDPKCRQYGTFIFGIRGKHGNCWSEGITTEKCRYWQHDQYNFYKLGSPGENACSPGGNYQGSGDKSGCTATYCDKYKPGGVFYSRCKPGASGHNYALEECKLTCGI